MNKKINNLKTLKIVDFHILKLQSIEIEIVAIPIWYHFKLPPGILGLQKGRSLLKYFLPNGRLLNENGDIAKLQQALSWCLPFPRFTLQMKPCKGFDTPLLPQQSHICEMRGTAEGFDTPLLPQQTHICEMHGTAVILQYKSGIMKPL